MLFSVVEAELLQTEDVTTSKDTVWDNLEVSGRWFVNFLESSIRYYLGQKQKAAEAEMRNEQTHSLVELGLHLNQIKGQIAALREKERATTDPAEKDKLQKDLKSLENKEAAVLKEMKELQAERRGS
jgi:predicted mannosyl-3-phosphoglycerate phosphatase (HAD superfamily)